MSESNDAAQAIYLKFFGSVAENADYFEPSNGTDFLLAETLIASIAATILTSFIGGVFGELGKSLATKLKTRVFHNVSIVDAAPSAMIAELAKLLESPAATPDRIAAGETVARQKLEALGLAPDVAAKLAADLATSILGHRAS